MSSLFALRALLFAGECFAGSVLLLGLAAAATRFLTQAALRHFVWLTAFGAMLVLPLAAVIVPPQIVLHRAAEANSATAAIVVFPLQVDAQALPDKQRSSWNLSARDVALGLAVLWSLGFGWAVLRLLIGAIGVNALQMSSTPFRRGEVEQLASEVNRCEVRLAGEDSGPMTWGVARPVILLPNASVAWPPERLTAVLLHEMAHVRRRDSLAQTISLMACALYWPNPLAWIGARALRRDAEIAADDEVIRAGMKPSTYAEELLQIAASVRGTSAVLAGVSMASQSSLERRLEALLSATSSRRGVTSMDVLKIASLGLLATTAVAFARPTLAEDASPQTARVRPAPTQTASAAPAVLPVVAARPAVAAVPVVAAQKNLPTPPVAPDAPPAPPAPAAPPALPIPAPPSANEIVNVDSHGDPMVDIVKYVDGHRVEIHRRHLTREERKKVRMVILKTQEQIHAAIEKARPEMRRAMAEIERTRPELEHAMQQIHDAQPQIAMAIEQARADLGRAKFDHRMTTHVEEALRRADDELHQQRMGMEHRQRQIDSGADGGDDSQPN